MADENIINPMIQLTTKDINEDFKNNSEYLKKAAGNFIKGIRKVINKYNHIKVLQRGNSTGIRGKLQEIYSNMKESTLITQECIKLQYNFENALNKFLGREIYLLYVTQEGKMLYANEINAAKIYRTAVARSGGKGSIKDLKTQQLKDFPEEIAENFETTLRRRQNLYKPIQDEVIERWTHNHNDTYGWVQRNPKLVNTFYWKENNKWNWSKTINRGHIYETYAHLVWQENQELSFNPEIELDIGRFWYYMDSHGLLNSIAGVVQGDVSFFLNPSIQFAVKSGNFNTAAMGSYIDVAWQLYYGNITINKNMVNTLLENLPSYSYNVRQYGLKKAEETLDSFIKTEIK